MFCIFLELMFFILKKNWEKCFLFHVKSPFRSQDILKFAFVPLPSRKPPSFCNFSDVIACFTIYGKEGFLEYLKNNNNYLLETWKILGYGCRNILRYFVLVRDWALVPGSFKLVLIADGLLCSF